MGEVEFSLAVNTTTPTKPKSKVDDDISGLIHDFSIHKNSKNKIDMQQDPLNKLLLRFDSKDKKIKDFFIQNKTEIFEVLEGSQSYSVFKNLPKSKRDEISVFIEKNIDEVDQKTEAHIESLERKNRALDPNKMKTKIDVDNATRSVTEMQVDLKHLEQKKERYEKLLKLNPDDVKLQKKLSRINILLDLTKQKIQSKIDEAEKNGFRGDDIRALKNAFVATGLVTFAELGMPTPSPQFKVETLDLGENETLKSSLTDSTRELSKATLDTLKQNKSYQLIVDLLKAAKMTMEEFLKSVEKSKDFADSLKKLVDKAYEEYKQATAKAIDRKDIPANKLPEITGLIAGLKKDLASVEAIIKKAISLAQIKEKDPAVIKFDDFQKGILKFFDSLVQNLNNGNSEIDKAISLSRNGAFATLLSSLTPQGKRDLKQNIDSVEKSLDEMIKKVKGFLTENDLGNRNIKNEGIVMDDLNKLGDLIKGIKSMMTGDISSEQFTTMQNKLSMALGLQDKISESFNNKKGAIA